MDPITLGLIAAGGSALFQGIKGVQQTREAKEMQKNLGPRVNYQIPEEAKRALALYQNMAVSRTMPGQQLMQNMIDMQQAKALGGATRAATSSQDLLSVATQLGEQGMEQQQALGVQAAQDYTRRQQDLAGALGTMAGYQEKVTADKQQDWYERAAAAREMREAGLQNTMGAVQGLGQMGMMAAMGEFGGEKTTDIGSVADSFTKSSELPSAVDFSPMSGKNLVKTMMQNRQAAQVPPPVATGQAQFGNTWNNFNSSLQFQQNPSYNGGSIYGNPTQGAIFPTQGIPYLQTGGLMPNTTSLNSFVNAMKNFNFPQ